VLAAVEEALWRYQPVRSRELGLDWALDAAGTLTLDGFAPSRTIKETLLEIAASVRGVQRVEDRIVADPDLEIAVARALADDPKTAGVPAGSVQVFAQLGNVVLVGDLPESLLAEVLRVAGQVPGVRRVVDRLDQA
jgi:osmotically-inducible protein OsmY